MFNLAQYQQWRVGAVTSSLNMGYLAHHTIVVTGWQTEKVKEARHKAFLIFEDHFAKSLTGRGGQLVSEVLFGVVNDQASFFIAPDGSKEGWGDSDTGDAARKEFLDWLRDSDNYCDYVEIVFGGDDHHDRVIRSNVNEDDDAE